MQDRVPFLSAIGKSKSSKSGYLLQNLFQSQRLDHLKQQQAAFLWNTH